MFTRALPSFRSRCNQRDHQLSSFCSTPSLMNTPRLACVRCLRPRRIQRPQCRRITVSAPGPVREDNSPIIDLTAPGSSTSLFGEQRIPDLDPDKPGQSSTSEGSSQEGLYGAAFESSPASHPLVEEAPTEPQMAVARVPLPSPFIVPVRRSRQPFDTHAFVSRLENATLSPETSKALMELVRGLVMQRTERAATNMLSKEELDNVSLGDSDH